MSGEPKKSIGDDASATDGAIPAIRIVIEELDKRGQYRATIDGWIAVESSHQPFLEAARVLLRRGVDPYTPIEMWRPDGETWALRSTVGQASALNVNNKGPGFEKWRDPNRPGGLADLKKRKEVVG